MKKEYKAIHLGFYIRPTRKAPTKGNVWSVKGISPCLMAGMGGGGNIIPTILEINGKKF